MKLTHYINRYRTLSVWAFCFPKEINPYNLEFVSYTKISSQSKLKGLSIFSFDSVSFLRKSGEYFHCVGLADKVCYQIVLKLSK